MSSSPQDPSLWEFLNSLEEKLITGIHQSSQTVLPQLLNSFDQLQEISKTVYDKSIHQLSSVDYQFLQSILPTRTNNSNPASTGIITSTPQLSSVLSTGSLPSSSTRWFLKPRNLIILAALGFSSRFTLDLLISSSYFTRWARANPSVSKCLPRWITSRSKRIRTRTARRRSSTTPSQSRPEIILLLGADPGSAGHHIALHLTQIGFIVIASVSRPEYVSPVESDGLGWLKALVLDPSAVHQSRAFNRSLLASLNLSFPLDSNAPSDAHQSSLVGLVNCLPISVPDTLRPVETLDLDAHLISNIQSVAGLSLQVIKVVLPLIRNSIEKFGANDGLILTLFPTKTTSVPLPYLGSSVIANQTLETLMTTLRREMMISNSESKQFIRVINEKIGTFRPSQHFTSPANPTGADEPTPSLPIHLHGIYAASLSRRIGLLNLPTTGLAMVSPKGSPLTQLIKRIQEIVQTPAIQTGSSVRAGTQVWKFKTITSFLPERWVEHWLQWAETLNGWVRMKLMGDIDLESNATLERVIEKRKFSSRSEWMNHVFAEPRELITPADLSEPAQPAEGEHAEGEGDVTLTEPEPAPPAGQPEAEAPMVAPAEPGLPAPPEFSSAGAFDTPPSGDETGSVIDKGEAFDSPVPHPLNDSFVGSEIDWKEASASQAA